MKRITCAFVLLALAGGAANAQGLVDFDGTELGLIGYSNPIYTYTGPGFGTDALLVSSSAFGSSAWVAGDAFWPMTRADFGPNAVGMPFGISDDSVAGATGNTPFPTDVQGFAGVALDNNGFFGVIDTENGLNTGPVIADFVFDITGLSSIRVAADFAAMGDFEATGDFFTFEYSIDGAPFSPLFTASVDEAISQTYTMDNVANNPVIIDDPLLMNGILLDDNYLTIAAPVAGTGSALTIRFSAQTDGGSEAFGFDNLLITPEPASLLALALAGVLFRRR